MGDFNVPDINWSTLVGSTHFSNQFCDVVFDLNLSQLVDSSTHKQGNILNLVLTNIEDSIHSLTVLNRNHQLISSDHYPITFVLSHSVISPTHNPPIYFYDFSKGDYEGLSHFLANCDFSDCNNSDDVEFIWFIIKSYIISAMELYIPKVKVRSHQYPKWFTAHLRHQVKCLRTLLRKIKIILLFHSLTV